MSELDRLVEAARGLDPEPVDGPSVDRAVTHAAVTGRARHRAWVRRRVFLAAGLGAAAAAAAMIFWVLPMPGDAPAPANLATVPTARPESEPERERTDFELPTGDRLLAEEGARFHVELATEHERRVRLSSGSMLFDVQPLEGGRFTVRTPTAEVVVLGTVFTVTAGRGGTVVHVYEGRVEVRHGDTVLRISAGEQTLIGEAPEAPDPLALDARRAARDRRPPSAPPVVEPDPPAPRQPPRARPSASAVEVRGWIADRNAQRALDEARRHVDAGDLDPWLLIEADALRALGRHDEAADAYGRAAERLASPRAEQAGFASARLRREPELALRALDAGRVTAPGSPLRERGLALRVDLLGRLGRGRERREAANAYLTSYPTGSRADAMRALLGDGADP